MTRSRTPKTRRPMKQPPNQLDRPKVRPTDLVNDDDQGGNDSSSTEYDEATIDSNMPGLLQYESDDQDDVDGQALPANKGPSDARLPLQQSVQDVVKFKKLKPSRLKFLLQQAGVEFDPTLGKDALLELYAQHVAKVEEEAPLLEDEESDEIPPLMLAMAPFQPGRWLAVPGVNMASFVFFRNREIAIQYFGLGDMLSGIVRGSNSKCLTLLRCATGQNNETTVHGYLATLGGFTLLYQNLPPPAKDISMLLDAYNGLWILRPAGRNLRSLVYYNYRYQSGHVVCEGLSSSVVLVSTQDHGVWLWVKRSSRSSSMGPGLWYVNAGSQQCWHENVSLNAIVSGDETGIWLLQSTGRFTLLQHISCHGDTMNGTVDVKLSNVHAIIAFGNDSSVYLHCKIESQWKLVLFRVLLGDGGWTEVADCPRNTTVHPNGRGGGVWLWKKALGKLTYIDADGKAHDCPEVFPSDAMIA